MILINLQGNLLELNKKIIATIIIVLLFFAGLIAVTQESGVFLAELEYEIVAGEEDENHEDFPLYYNLTVEVPEWVGPSRWFRSNKGGMAIEEMPRFAALRNEYALAVAFAHRGELPEYLYPYYDDKYFIEVRVLYEKGEQIRTQWIFKGINGTTRVISSISEQPESGHLSGYIEIMDEGSFLISEYRFFDDGRKSRTDYTFKNDLLISSVVLYWDDKGREYKEAYADFLRYNRSLYLRAVERVFYNAVRLPILDEPLRISFPRRLTDAVENINKNVEKLNSYPEFFGDVFIDKNGKIVYTTDERSRIISQTLYDEEDNIIWVISNTWLNDRIVSTLKKEGDTVLLSEYEYNSDGDRIRERNFKNGILERQVRSQGKTDIEELYLNNVVVLRAVWEDGRKISETRPGSR